MSKEALAQQAAAKKVPPWQQDFAKLGPEAADKFHDMYNWLIQEKGHTPGYLSQFSLPELAGMAHEKGWAPLIGQGKFTNEKGVSLSPGFKSFEKNYKLDSIVNKAEGSLWDAADDAGNKFKSIADNFKKELSYKNLPVNEAVRQLNAKQMGYTTPSFRGVSQEPRRSPTSNWGDELQYYSTTNPKLAEMYAREFRKGDDRNPQIQPLLLNTEKYHTVDAGGKVWEDVNSRAVREAKKAGAQGVIIHNVIDEPHSTNKLGPQTIYITLDPATARSKFARFDPAKAGLNDLLASGAGVAVATGAAHKILQNPDGTLQAAQE